MSIEQHLNFRKIQNPLNKFKSDLENDQNGNFLINIFSPKKFKPEVATLGLAFLKKIGDYNEAISMGSEQDHRFMQLLIPDVWENENYYKLLVYFFGAEKAVFVKLAWDKMPLKMYQDGYSRRSFRAPNNANFVRLNQVNFLRSILNPISKYNYTTNSRDYFDLSMEERIIYDNDLVNNNYEYLIWSIALDSGNDRIYSLMEDIIFNRHEKGKVTRNIIKALLNSENEKNWQLVEKLLLSAQRQEGLRQTILEALDETSFGALKYMIKVILENKLTRFSSVVRAVDTWTGLGWEGEKETVIRQSLEMADGFLNNPDSIKLGIGSKNNTEVYMALWSLGVLDVNKTVPYLTEFLEKGTIEKKSLALKFASETNDPYIEMPLYFKALDDDNLQVIASAVPGMELLLSANVKSEVYCNSQDYPGFFEKIYTLTQKIDVKEKTFTGKVFSWHTIKFEKNTLYRCLAHLVGQDKGRFDLLLQHFEEFSIELRESITRSILKEFYTYGYENVDDKKKRVPTDFQKQFALRVLKDRGETIMNSAIFVLSNCNLNSSDLQVFVDLFKRKNSSLRKNLIKLLEKQIDREIKPLINELIVNGDIEQRCAALELMGLLSRKERLRNEISSWIIDYKEKNKISEREEKLLEQLQPVKKEELLSEANGYTLFDPSNTSSYSLPTIERDSLYSRLTKNEKYGFTMSVSQIAIELEKLYQLFLKNSNFEYEIENYDGSKERVLLVNGIRFCKTNLEGLSGAQKFENIPLAMIWENWFIESGLVASDLFLLTLVENCQEKIFKDVLDKMVFFNEKVIPNPNRNTYYSWNNPVLNILKALKFKYVFIEKNEFLIDAAIKIYSNLPTSILRHEIKQREHYYSSFENGNGWQELKVFDVFLNEIELETLSKSQVKKIWDIYRWRQFNGKAENSKYNRAPIYVYCLAYQHEFITKDELIDGILVPERINVLTSKTRHYRHYGSENLIEQFPFLEPILNTIREKLLDVELKRGDVGTPVTKFVQNFQKIYGINRFTEILIGLGKGNLFKGYIYTWGNEEFTKQQLFSTLLKRCYPKSEDTQELFNSLMTSEKISELRLIQAAVYAPQWQSYISNYLGWKGLDSAIWWMHAHTKNPEYQSQNAELESEVTKYSAIDLNDFKDGAVDKHWFEIAYKQLGKAKWEMLYDSAKYVSDGNGHRRARLYADTILGELKIREVTAKVKDKRDQDYLRVYGLVPLSKTNPEKDVLARYEYLQQFKKESREFGSMRQASEALAIRVALENLARNAGFTDPMRLTWAMETKQVQNILSKDTLVQFDEIKIGLKIDEEGKADVVAYKDEKPLKTIPAKYKKHATVLEFQKSRKTLREQFNRSRKGLEEAMIRGDEFLFSEIANLFEHPIISKHLEKLLFISDNKAIGFYKSGMLIGVSGKTTTLDEQNNIRIAHCVDLHQLGVWTEFQTYCFEEKIKQPFKQIFRELYIPTADELEEKSISRRYAGHQVHPKQTLALLKTRGWKVDYEEGLQKVFHKEGLQVKLYAMADWFSPSDVESPTLETIEFHSLKDGKNIPFEAINPRIFSETMRDVDLVVSVAHVGGVDPEMSHSSIEMRAALLRETLRLFKLSNVEVEGSHARIKGILANYSVHMGSAIVHQMPGKYISILPVHSQHRGRIFLPFADDDPRSAELLSKVLLLAKDNEIQDPTILSQIERTV